MGTAELDGCRLLVLTGGWFATPTPENTGRQFWSGLGVGHRTARTTKNDPVYKVKALS